MQIILSSLLALKNPCRSQWKMQKKVITSLSRLELLRNFFTQSSNLLEVKLVYFSGFESALHPLVLDFKINIISVKIFACIIRRYGLTLQKPVESSNKNLMVKHFEW